MESALIPIAVFLLVYIALTMELVNKADGWRFEAAYWAEIDVQTR